MSEGKIFHISKGRVRRARLAAAMVSTITSWLIKGLPRQLIEMWENKRCSILFHLLVPGGRWHTVIARPVSAASAASSVFHCRVRYPLEPPPSALISRRVALGAGIFPALRHQVLMVLTANAAVSWSVPTDTHPVLVPTSYTS